MFPIAAALLFGYAVSSYILLKKPHLLHARKQFPFIAQHISHRGGAGESIENTLSAFKKAQNAGTHMFELDCRLTKDGQVVVFHDASVERCTGVVEELCNFDYRSLPNYLTKLKVTFEPGHFCDKTSASPEPILLLRDVFENFPTMPVNIDIKANDDRLIKQVADLIVQYNREKLTIWGGMNRRVYRKCRKVQPDILTYPPAEYLLAYVIAYHIGLLPFLPIPYDCFEMPLIPVLKSKGIIIGDFEDCWWTRTVYRIVEYLMTSPGLFEHLKLRGIPVFSWVANSDNDFQLAVNLGASGIMTDFPTRLRQFLDKNPQLATGKS